VGGLESSRSDGWVPVRLGARASLVKWRVIAYVGDCVIADLSADPSAFDHSSVE
jgi:hypothetical protein